MDIDGYADRIMTFITAERDRGFPLVAPEQMPGFYLVKAQVPAALRPAVAEEVARRLRDRGSPAT